MIPTHDHVDAFHQCSNLESMLLPHVREFLGLLLPQICHFTCRTVFYLLDLLLYLLELQVLLQTISNHIMLDLLHLIVECLDHFCGFIIFFIDCVQMLLLSISEVLVLLL
jgi:hypothetical protein